MISIDWCARYYTFFPFCPGKRRNIPNHVWALRTLFLRIFPCLSSSFLTMFRSLLSQNLVRTFSVVPCSLPMQLPSIWYTAMQNLVNVASQLQVQWDHWILFVSLPALSPGNCIQAVSWSSFCFVFSLCKFIKIFSESTFGV